MLWNIHEQITQRWQAALTNEAGGQIARDYLEKRGVTDEAVKLFRLGYAPEAWDDTVNWAKSKGHDLAVVEQAVTESMQWPAVTNVVGPTRKPEQKAGFG